MSKAPVAMTLLELNSLLLKAKEHRDERAYVMFLLGAMHGLRISELINLRRQNFSQASGEIYLTVQRLKGSKKTVQRLLPSPEPLFNEVEAVRGYLSELRGDHLFTNERGERLTRWGGTFLMERYGTWAGIPRHKRFCHALKHTCGILLRKSGASLEVIQETLGHARLDSTAMYLRTTAEDVDEARAKAFIRAETAVQIGQRRRPSGSSVYPKTTPTVSYDGQMYPKMQFWERLRQTEGTLRR